MFKNIHAQVTNIHITYSSNIINIFYNSSCKSSLVLIRKQNQLLFNVRYTYYNTEKRLYFAICQARLKSQFFVSKSFTIYFDFCTTIIGNHRFYTNNTQ